MASEGRAAALVTGAAGFLGRRLLRRLLARGCVVVALDRRPWPDLPKGETITWVFGSLEDSALQAQAVGEIERRGGRGAVLYHLAGASHVGACQADPERAFRINCEAALELVRRWLERGLRRVVFPSTGLVYRLRSGMEPLREDAPVAPRNVYAATKLAAEEGLRVLAEGSGLSVDIARLSNVYGGRGAAPDTVVSEALSQALAGRSPVLRRPGVRLDFLYAEDAAEGLIRLAEAGKEPGCRLINLSTGRGRLVAEMGELVRRLAGLPEPAPADLSAGRGEGLVLDNTRLKGRTGWVPEFDLEMGLREALAELRDHG